ncbi:hypothetical protein ACODT5_24975 [Streptomyces sp. 5.8]|uniref:hypothetical protein n=1 Tax=Streptomyces sp. 5.8 TaxID=3406571 RepID=UPI003BB4FACF
MEHVRGETPDASPGAGRVTPNHQVGEKAREGHPAVLALDDDRPFSVTIVCGA